MKPSTKGGSVEATGEHVEVALEQQQVDAMYATLDRLRAQARSSLADVLRRPTAGTPQGLTERDALATFYERRAVELEGVEDRLVFGRLDSSDGTRRYIGRAGLPSAESDASSDPLLVDWRAPVAAPFYQATPAAPGDVVRRRHLTTHARTVVAVEDEALDLDALDDAERATLVGEGALMSAVTQARTGRMGDIVATIQSEQDRIVRSELQGVLVVQGGPGTGKTAVALHRIAYLMYTFRERLERSGVLMVGPSPVFLRYIERVLPALGESGTVMRTPGMLFPGVEATTHDGHETARLKGDARMAHVVARAVERRQRIPTRPVDIELDGARLTLRPEAFVRARAKARSGGLPHNRARVTFVRSMLDHLVDQLARVQGIDLRLDPETRADLQGDLRDSIDVRRALNLAWMPLTPERILAELLTDVDVLTEVAPEFSPAERNALLRSPEEADAWTVEDVPLLDELAELIGDDDAAERMSAAVADAQRRQDLETARSSLLATGGDAARMVSAEMLVDRFSDTGPRLSVAEHAERDRSWTFGHVVVDEAQELSAMQWRVLVRRCPSRSMTLVGDVAQTGSAAGTRDWGTTMESIAPGRWRTESLTVNYRTPQRVIELAEASARAHGLVVDAQRTVRVGERDPEQIVAGSVDDVVSTVLAEYAGLGDGRLAVIAASVEGAWGVDAIRCALVDELGDRIGGGAEALEHPVAVLDPTSSKGLEVDVVVVVDPEGIRQAGGPFGTGDVFVAMTRPTRALILISPEQGADPR